MTNSQFFELATSNGLNIISVSHRDLDKEGKVKDFKVMFAYGFESVKDANEFADIYGLTTTACVRYFDPSYQRGWKTHIPGCDCIDVDEILQLDFLDWKWLDSTLGYYLQEESKRNVEDINFDELIESIRQYKFYRDVLLREKVGSGQFLYFKNMREPIKVYEHGLPHYIFDNKECVYGVFNRSEMVQIG